MFFGFFRRLRRKLTVCAVIILTVVILKQACPGIGMQVGEWISGMRKTRAVQAMSSFVSSLTSGDGVKKVMEVFRETLQIDTDS